jgi:hypothetical protein
MQPTPQYRLEANGDVIARSQPFGGRDGTIRQDIVLRYDPDNYTPFISHHRGLNRDDVPSDNYFWGHYFSDLPSALLDFAERCKQYGVHVERLEGFEIRK